MYTFLKIALALIGLYFVFDMSVYLILKNKIKDNVKLSDIMGKIALEFGIYTLIAFIFAVWAFLNLEIKQGIIMSLFALSPFIIGRLATYHTKHIFTGIQFLVIILSVVYGFVSF